jgi:hypothetical protein
MKSQLNSASDIFYSYRIFFPDEKNISEFKISNINADLLKTAYKKLVFQNHPDRSRYLNLKESELKDRMIKINCAYENISAFMKTRKIIHTHRHKQHSPDKKHEKPGHESRYHYIPKKKIFFGQYLLYSGSINLSTLISALNWQRRHRDNFGKIAVNWKIMDTKKLIDVLKAKKNNERIGECALRLGYMNNFQLTAILAKQKNSKNLIGEYFIRNNIIDKNEIERFAILHRQHNYLYV